MSTSKMQTDIARMYKERIEEIQWRSLGSLNARHKDYATLRDCLVDMCSATLSDTPPSQEDWNVIRTIVKNAAAKHALLVREDKKSPKPPLVSSNIRPTHNMNLNMLVDPAFILDTVTSA